MTDSVKKAVEKYIDMMSKNMDVKMKFEDIDGSYYLNFVVDYARFDKNSKKYDETYYNKLYSAPSGFFKSKDGKVKSFAHTIVKLFGIKDLIKAGFEFDNYQHLDKVEKSIKKAQKKFFDSKNDLDL